MSKQSNVKEAIDSNALVSKAFGYKNPIAESFEALRSKFSDPRKPDGYNKTQAIRYLKSQGKTPSEIKDLVLREKDGVWIPILYQFVNNVLNQGVKQS